MLKNNSHKLLQLTSTATVNFIEKDIRKKSLHQFLHNNSYEPPSDLVLRRLEVEEIDLKSTLFSLN